MKRNPDLVDVIMVTLLVIALAILAIGVDAYIAKLFSDSAEPAPTPGPVQVIQCEHQAIVETGTNLIIYCWDPAGND